jgi:hypothetical protein
LFSLSLDFYFISNIVCFFLYSWFGDGFFIPRFLLVSSARSAGQRKAVAVVYRAQTAEQSRAEQQRGASLPSLGPSFSAAAASGAHSACFCFVRQLKQKQLVRERQRTK